MYAFLCDFGGNTVRFLTLLYFSSRLNNQTFHTGIALIWIVPWLLLQHLFSSHLFVCIFGFLYLFLYGIVKSKLTWKYAAWISVLFLSVTFWANGIIETIGFWVAKEIGSKYIWILQVLDFIIMILSCGLLYLFLLGISKLFHYNLQCIHQKIFLVLIFPFLFILLSEQFLSSAIYGDTIIWSYTGGLMYPQIQTVPMLTIKILAGMTVLSILLLLCRLEKNIFTETDNKFLAHQILNQSVYIQEIKSREKQFCSLQHDIKNHFLLLQELLYHQKFQEATNYLADLEKISHTIDYPVQTGNAIVDILLKNKLALANQNGITIQCHLIVPAISTITDMEWCIILGNAIDNVCQAIETVSKDRRYLHIIGTQKGNFLYLHIENACSESLTTIVEGVGLSNIRTVVTKHKGTLDIDIDSGKFSLDILLLISQQ